MATESRAESCAQSINRLAAKNRPIFFSTRTIRSIGIRGAKKLRESAQGKQTDLSLDRLFDLPLVPRHGA